MAMPASQVVVAEYPLIFVDEGKISAIIARVVKNVDEYFFAQIDSHLESESTPVDNGQDSIRKSDNGCLPHLVFKPGDLPAGVYTLWLRLRQTKLPRGG